MDDTSEQELIKLLYSTRSLLEAAIDRGPKVVDSEFLFVSMVELLDQLNAFHRICPHLDSRVSSRCEATASTLTLPLARKVHRHTLEQLEQQISEKVQRSKTSVNDENLQKLCKSNSTTMERRGQSCVSLSYDSKRQSDSSEPSNFSFETLQVTSKFCGQLEIKWYSFMKPYRRFWGSINNGYMFMFDKKSDNEPTLRIPLKNCSVSTAYQKKKQNRTVLELLKDNGATLRLQVDSLEAEQWVSQIQSEINELSHTLALVSMRPRPSKRWHTSRGSRTLPASIRNQRRPFANSVRSQKLFAGSAPTNPEERSTLCTHDYQNITATPSSASLQENSRVSYNSVGSSNMCSDSSDTPTCPLYEELRVDRPVGIQSADETCKSYISDYSFTNNRSSNYHNGHTCSEEESYATLDSDVATSFDEIVDETEELSPAAKLNSANFSSVRSSESFYKTPMKFIFKNETKTPKVEMDVFSIRKNTSHGTGSNDHMSKQVNSLRQASAMSSSSRSTDSNQSTNVPRPTISTSAPIFQRYHESSPDAYRHTNDSNRNNTKDYDTNLYAVSTVSTLNRDSSQSRASPIVHKETFSTHTKIGGAVVASFRQAETTTGVEHEDDHYTCPRLHSYLPEIHASPGTRERTLQIR